MTAGYAAVSPGKNKTKQWLVMNTFNQ